MCDHSTRVGAAINRLVNGGLVDRRIEPGAAAAQRYMLSLTEAGRAELRQRLRHPADHEITDGSRFFTILAFLSHLLDIADQHAVLRRRLEFLEKPASFFYDGNHPLRAEDVRDPYRRGMLLVARATSRAERAWLHEILDAPEHSPVGPGHPEQDATSTSGGVCARSMVRTAGVGERGVPRR
jgi:DNA-binding MarR family transcriptional regulator